MDKALEEFRQQENKVLEILGRYPRSNYVAKRSQTMLEVPYEKGIVWYRDPDPEITRILRKSFS